MSAAAEARAPKPVTDFVKLPEGGAPYLEGHKCGACGTMFIGAREVCSKCFARGKMQKVKLSGRGKLYAYTIVYRSFPGVEVPFVSAVVDLDGGGTLKGNLIGVKPEPAAIKMGMPVEVVFKDAGRKDREGSSYVAYFFQPAA